MVLFLKTKARGGKGHGMKCGVPKAIELTEKFVQTLCLVIIVHLKKKSSGIGIIIVRKIMQVCPWVVTCV